MRRGLTALAALALSGCAALAPGDPEWRLASPASLGRTVAAQQRVQLAFVEGDVTLDAAVSADPAILTLVALSPLGQRLFSARWDGDALTVERSPQAGAVDPAALLADVQRVLWPLPALQSAAAGSCWQIAEPRPGLRRIRCHGRLHSEVRYQGDDPWHGKAWLANFAAGYSAEIDSRVLAP